MKRSLDDDFVCATTRDLEYITLISSIASTWACVSAQIYSLFTKSFSSLFTSEGKWFLEKRKHVYFHYIEMRERNFNWNWNKNHV